MRISISNEEFKHVAVRCKKRISAIYQYLKKGGIGAELGSFKGWFIESLLSTKPKKLYIVDPWYRLSSCWTWAKGEQSTVKALIHILYTFQSEIDERILEPRIQFSEEFLKSIPDKSLDWIYIDTVHTYEHTINELKLCLPKIKNDGYIVGDDYYPDPSHKHHGVYLALHEMQNLGKIKIVSAGEANQYVVIGTN
jgi:hypothetical protein